jgi:YidC/Oxa1 family membrane protein insertase
MFLVFVIHMVLTSRGRREAQQEALQPEVAQPEAVQEEALQPEEVIEEAGEATPEPVTKLVTPAEAAPLKRVVVTAPLYTCAFSSVGAVITSYELHEYLSDGDAPVQLIPAGGTGALGVGLVLEGGEYLDLSEVAWSASSDSVAVGDMSEAMLVFEFVTEQGLMISKTCRFQGSTYGLDVSIEVAGTGSDRVRAVNLGWQSGLSITEMHREKDDLNNFASITLTSEGLEKSNRGDVKKHEDIALTGDIKWVGVKTKYFFAALVPMDAQVAASHSFQAGEEGIGVSLDVERSTTGPERFVVYAGPLDYQRLKLLGHGLDRAVDFGWRWIEPLSKLMFRFMVFLHDAIPNYGLVIIILSALTKFLFYPLTQKSFRSMREMQKLQPEIEELREKHKKDPQRLNKAMMELYRERGVNPLGGCFPMLLQTPVFIALFNVLSRTIELRRAPFALWIKDLSAPDVIARLPFSLPFIGDTLSLLPILMGVAMFLQQKMSATDPKQAAMTYMLPIVFTILFFRFPSGLVLYWLINNVLTIGHQYLMTRADRKHAIQTTGG